jgi:DNA-3-methyladenine glycosylase I
MIAYHDHEWGVPLHDDVRLFELLILEGAQAGLSWSTILRKRDAYRKAFRGFRPERVARFGAPDRKRLLADAGIVRNRLKIEAAIENAKRFLEVRKELGSFDAYVWAFVREKPIVRRPGSASEVPVTSPEAEALSRDLKKRGFRFVGPTIVYAFLQAAGLVDDHARACFRSAKGKAGR